MKIKFYVSLTGPLLSIYYPMPFDDEAKCRVAISTSKLAKLWCSIYTAKQVDETIEQYGGVKLASEYARKLDYDSYAVEMAARNCGIVRS